MSVVTPSRASSAVLSGVGLGWRPETAWLIHNDATLGFTEIIAENVCLHAPLRRPLQQLVSRGTPVIPHGVSLSLGSAELPDRARLDRLARVAELVQAPFVSEHIAFVRGAGLETQHLLPVPRTREVLDITIENIRHATAVLPVPLVVENIAALFEWPENQLDEADFLAELLAATGVGLLLDLSNLHCNARNHGWDPIAFLDALPLDRVVYVHMAGGKEHQGMYHDTHAHPISNHSLALLSELCQRMLAPPVLLERDASFGSRAALEAELDAIRAVVTTGEVAHVA